MHIKRHYEAENGIVIEEALRREREIAKIKKFLKNKKEILSKARPKENPIFLHLLWRTKI